MCYTNRMDLWVLFDHTSPCVCWLWSNTVCVYWCFAVHHNQENHILISETGCTLRFFQRNSPSTMQVIISEAPLSLWKWYLISWRKGVFSCEAWESTRAINLFSLKVCVFVYIFGAWIQYEPAVCANACGRWSAEHWVVQRTLQALNLVYELITPSILYVTFSRWSQLISITSWCIIKHVPLHSLQRISWPSQKWMMFFKPHFSKIWRYCILMTPSAR